MSKKNTFLYHIITLLTIIVWGETFISTKVLIQHGVHPVDIMFFRFLIAYVGLLLFSYKQVFARNIKDECMLFLAGLTGGALYYFAENTALKLTITSNVAILVSLAPIFTIILSHYIFKDKLPKRMLIGSVIALVGVYFVVYQGKIEFNPVGDLLSILAGIMWAFYCIILKPVGKKYDTVFITRKVFFYSLVCIITYYFINHPTLEFSYLTKPIIYGNILFLGVVASMICFVTWNAAVKVLGPSKTSNYIYLQPFVTLLISSTMLNEQVSVSAIIGSVLIILGVYLAEK